MARANLRHFFQVDEDRSPCRHCPHRADCQSRSVACDDYVHYVRRDTTAVWGTAHHRERTTAHFRRIFDEKDD